MKQINYIVAFISCIFILSCGKEEAIVRNNWLDEGEIFYIDLVDTAGILVPEGYSLVVFPGSRPMTKVTGSETRIGHLQYIIYQDDGTGNYIQYADNRQVKTDLSSWPVKAIAISLPKEKNYKVVFLGNVDVSVFGNIQTRQVLSGTGKGTNYTDARILLPDVEFSNNTMYFFAKAIFNTNTEAYVPIILKRIVSRNDITREGIAEAYATGVNSDYTYKTAYWTQIVREQLKKDIFTGENSTFRYQVGEGLKRSLIYPLIYIGLAKPEDAADLASGYTAVAKYIAEWDAYKPSDTYTAFFDNMRLSYPEFMQTGDRYPNNTFIRYAQYLYDTFVEENSKDPKALEGALDSIFTDNARVKEDNVSQPSVSKAIDKLITALNTNYTSGPLLPWRFNSYTSRAVVDIKPTAPMPGAVDFDLNVDPAYDISGEKYYRLNSAATSTGDKYISLISLGDAQTSDSRLGISKIYTASSGGTGIDDVPKEKYELVGNEITAGHFHRNVRNVTTQKIRTVDLANPRLLLAGDNYMQKIQIVYYHMFQAMNPVQNDKSFTLGYDSRAQFTTENVLNVPAKLSRIQSYLLNWMNGNIYIQMEYQDYKTLSFPFATFTCPDVSSGNIGVTTTWETTEVQ